MTRASGNEWRGRDRSPRPPAPSQVKLDRALLTMRVLLVLLAVAPLLPWYRSVAVLEQETYFGNPLPWVDWVLIASAIAAVFRPSFTVAAAAFGVFHVASAGLAIYWDAAEGLDVQILPGLPFAGVVLTALLLARRKLSAGRDAATL